MGLWREIFGKRCSRCSQLIEKCKGHRVAPESGIKPGTRDQRGKMRQPRVPNKKGTGRKWGDR